tara:strand:+ start:564 stop:704 length:141 start_codon:yes stop_codon:yes gene_type:complete
MGDEIQAIPEENVELIYLGRQGSGNLNKLELKTLEDVTTKLLGVIQ